MVFLESECRILQVLPLFQNCFLLMNQESEGLSVITRAIKIMLTKIDKDKLWVNPDCGLKTRGVPETEASLKNMVKAAEIIRAEL